MKQDFEYRYRHLKRFEKLYTFDIKSYTLSTSYNGSIFFLIWQLNFKAYRDSKAYWNWNEENTEKGAQTSQEIKLVNLPQFVSYSKIDQTDNSRDDDGCQDEIRRVIEQRHEKQKSHKNRWCHDYVRYCCLCSSIVVNGRSRKRSCKFVLYSESKFSGEFEFFINYLWWMNHYLLWHSMNNMDQLCS